MNKKAGYLLVEVVVSIGIMGLIFWSLLSLQAALIRAKNDGIKKVRASYLAAEAQEAVRRERDRDGWANLYNNIFTFDEMSGTHTYYHPGLSSGDWQMLLSDETIGIYKRSVEFFKVERDPDCNGTIVASGGACPDDPNTRKVTATVSWDNGEKSVVIETYLTNRP